MNNKSLTLLLIFVFLGSLSYAQKSSASTKNKEVVKTYPKVEGAFGYKFGQKLDVSKLKKATNNRHDFGFPKYELPPLIKVRNFSSYYVHVTPTTHKIVSLSAVATFDDNQKRYDEQDLLAKIIMNKYGDLPRASTISNIVRGKIRTIN